MISDSRTVAKKKHDVYLVHFSRLTGSHTPEQAGAYYGIIPTMVGGFRVRSVKMDARVIV